MGTEPLKRPMLCDFCGVESKQDELINFPCRDFNLDPEGITSHGAFLACFGCADYIFLNDKKGLVRHCCNVHRKRHPLQPAESINYATRRIQEAFWENKL